MNRVVLVGRLTKDIELRYTQSGTAVASFSIAVNRRKKKDSNEQEADFINCTIWSKSAENLANFTSKGSRIAIDGRLQTSSYQNQEGKTVYRTEVIVETFDLLETRANSQKDNSNFNSTGMNGNNPFNQSISSNQEVEINDEDLPF